MRFLTILAAFALMLAITPSADADIFVKKDQSTNKSSNKSIFLSPNNNNANSRTVPQYPIITNGGNRSTNQKPLSFGTEAQRLQAQKLRDSRARAYKRNRAESINILTLAEDYSKRTGKTSMNQLLDRSAYNAASQMAEQASEQAAAIQAQQQQGQTSPTTSQYAQQIQQIQAKANAQVDAALAEDQRKLQEQNSGQNNRYDNTQRRSRGNSGIILTP